jgi:heavy metal translocating P-type ATPase
MVATGRGAQLGVLFKNAEVLENLHTIDTVVLDKTGTLTKGVPAVTDVIVGDVEESVLLTIAASLECRSEHPFAKAIMEYTADISYSEPELFEVHPGLGVTGRVGGIKYYGGNAKLMSSVGLSVPQYAQLSAAGKTPLYFASEDGLYLGAIAAADVLREDSAEAVKALHKLGLSVVMLTGDNEATAYTIANKVGIDNVIADVLPGEKAGAIQNLRLEGRKVLMIGDGINDAPALVTADVGMAIGNGTDIAIEAADVVLMKPSLFGAVSAIALSKATIRNIRQNLFWAFFYNILGIPIAAGALYPAFRLQLNPMIGSAAMSMSSVFVVTNALRLRFFNPGTIKPDTSPKIQKESNEMETIIKVNGMMCPHCKARVESVCQEISGTESAVVDLQKKIVTVIGTADVNELKKAITAAGYEVVD